MPQLIIAVLILIALYYIVVVALTAIVLALGPIIVGWITFECYRRASQLRVKAAVDRRLPELLEISPASANLAFRARSDALRLFPESADVQTVSVLVAVAASAACYTAMGMSGGFVQRPNDSEIPVILMAVLVFCAVAAGLWLTIMASLRSRPHERVVSDHLEKHVARLNRHGGSTAKFDEANRKHSELMKELAINASDKRRGLMEAIGASFAEKLLTIGTFQPLIDEYTEALQLENRELDLARHKFAALKKLCDVACREANRAGNSAAFHCLEALLRRVSGLTANIEHGRLDAFNQDTECLHQEIERLIENIDRLKKGEETSSDRKKNERRTDPYEILGIRRDLSIDEIKAVYRALAQLYHPDKGRAKDHTKFQEIQGAWGSICKERGLA